MSLALLLMGVIGFTQIWTRYNQPTPFEELAIRKEAKFNEQACFAKQSHLEKQPVALVQICGTLGAEHYIAAIKYPQISPKLYQLYGNMPEWHEIVYRYGAKVIPIVWEFYENGSIRNQLELNLKESIKQIRNWEFPKWNERRLTKLENGYITIMTIHEHGHRFLDRFRLVDGELERKTLSTIMSELVTFFSSGINALENKYVDGKEIKLKDVGWAALDVGVVALVVTGTVSAMLHKKSAAVTTKAMAAKGVATKGAAAKYAVLKSASLGALKTLGVISAKAAPYAAIVGFGYLAVTHPVDTTILTAGALRWTMEQAGVSTPLAFTASWLMIATLLWLLLWPFTFLAKWSYKSRKLVTVPAKAVINAAKRRNA